MLFLFYLLYVYNALIPLIESHFIPAFKLVSLVFFQTKKI